MKLKINYLNSCKKGTVNIKNELKVAELLFANFMKSDSDFPASFSKRVNEIELSLSICGKQKIRTLNREYLSRDYVTDVLSFPVNSSFVHKHRKIIPLFDRMDLGDIYICKEKAKLQAKEFAISEKSEIIHLLVHGFLHLIGYDHELSLIEEKRMEQNEALLVDAIMKKKKRG